MEQRQDKNGSQPAKTSATKVLHRGTAPRPAYTTAGQEKRPSWKKAKRKRAQTRPTWSPGTQHTGRRQPRSPTRKRSPATGGPSDTVAELRDTAPPPHHEGDEERRHRQENAVEGIAVAENQTEDSPAPPQGGAEKVSPHHPLQQRTPLTVYRKDASSSS
ncbi:uncharacterized protein LOC144769238 isoform X2 [Lissotriton helveticus]